MDAVEEIKGRISIDDVVGRYVDLKRSGASYKGLCPFHQEKTPSFYVTPARGTYHCFGCGKGGDLFSFLMETERLTFPEALKRLADQAGVSLPEREPAKPSLKGRLYEANEVAARYFAEALTASRPAQEYLRSRSFGREAVDLFGLGFATEAREGLVAHMRGAGFDDRILLEAGLAMQDDIGSRSRDRFHRRLMFPIRDASGKISGFGGRTLGDAQPKYLNSPQTEIFDKSSVLFGIHRAQDAIRQAAKAVLVEGYLDAIRAHLGGFSNTVASLGTAVTTQQLLTLNRLTDTVVLALDPDAAGQAAAARTGLNALIEVTKAKGRATGAAGALDLRIARLPEGRGDPDDLIRDVPELWEQALANSVPAFDFYFAQTMDSLDRSTEGWRQDAIDRLLPLIQQFSSSAGWQAMWVQRLGAETGIDVQAIQRAMPGAQGGRGRRRPMRQDDRGKSIVARTTSRGLSVDPEVDVVEGLLALLLQIVVIPRDAAPLLTDVNFGRAEARALVDRLLTWQESNNYDYEMLRETLPEDVVSYADDLRGRGAPVPDDGKISVAVAFHLARLRQFRLHSELRRATETLKTLPTEEQMEAVAQVQRLYGEQRAVEEQLDRLSKMVVKSEALTSDQGMLNQGTIDQDSGRL